MIKDDTEDSAMLSYGIKSWTKTSRLGGFHYPDRQLKSESHQNEIKETV